ncbi:MAG: hypothetical protein NTZ26_11225 [Candidatus Aminicenantes bacterium]|nr:hypothetical protein [Candidatus Aminicenantes bacterium]
MTYTNRMRNTYYLLEGRTKTGKVRYCAVRTLREGALPAMPEGFEFSESINGVVSVRRIDSAAASVPEADVSLARREMARFPHLRGCRIEVVKGEIVVFEPRNRHTLRLDNGQGHHTRDDTMMRRVQYDPVMKFAPSRECGGYWVHRMTYLGDGGWSWPLAAGSLSKLLKRFLGCVRTDEFFELM